MSQLDPSRVPAATGATWSVVGPAAAAAAAVAGASPDSRQEEDEEGAESAHADVVGGSQGCLTGPTGLRHPSTPRSRVTFARPLAGGRGVAC